MSCNDPATQNIIKVHSIQNLDTPMKCIGHIKNYDMLIFLCEKETKQCCDLTKLNCTPDSGLLISEHSCGDISAATFVRRH